MEEAVRSEEAYGRITRERLLDAAEHLFAQHGFEGTSIRAVTTEAGANLAAVGYHFGSKVALFKAVAERVMGPVIAGQLERLNDLEQRGKEPEVEELVEAFIAPYFDRLPRKSEARGRTVSRLVGRILGDPAEEIRKVAVEGGEVRDRYLVAFRKALPKVTQEELWWRMRSMIGVVVVHRIGLHEEVGPLGMIDESDETVLEWTVSFLSAALRTPSANAL
jgi:AcrR family transcriptional regulator